MNAVKGGKDKLKEVAQIITKQSPTQKKDKDEEEEEKMIEEKTSSSEKKEDDDLEAKGKSEKKEKEEEKKSEPAGPNVFQRLRERLGDTATKITSSIRRP